jgi:hypothetical protein
VPKLLPIAAVIEALEKAFRPLECRVERVDGGQKLRLHFFDPTSNTTLKPVQMLTRLARKLEVLWLRIYRVRAGLADAGFKLDPWTPPAQ